MLRIKEEIIKDMEVADTIRERDKLKIEVMLDVRDILDDIRELKQKQMEIMGYM